MFNRLFGPRLNLFHSGTPANKIASAVSSLAMTASILPGPQAASTESARFSHPVAASALPLNDGGTSVGTLNTASGAGRWFIKDWNRTRQGHLVAKLANGDANIVGFQEVDTDVGRTGRGVNTAVDLASHINPGFDAFAHGQTPQRVSLDAPAPQGVATRVGSDGTTVFQIPGASVVEARSFGTVDRAGGVDGDRTPDAAFGNAFYLSGNQQLLSEYTVSLPSAGSGGPAVASDQLLASLASGNVTAEQRAELAQVNNQLRAHAGSEPRSALVLRVRGPDGVTRTFIDTHLTNGWTSNPAKNAPTEAIRQAQLAFLARVIQAEHASGREVVFLGDMNDSTQALAPTLTALGMQLMVGGRSGGLGNFDQEWATSNVPFRNAAQVPTEFVTDHTHAGYAQIPPEGSTTG